MVGSMSLPKLKVSCTCGQNYLDTISGSNANWEHINKDYWQYVQNVT